MFPMKSALGSQFPRQASMALGYQGRVPEPNKGSGARCPFKSPRRRSSDFSDFIISNRPHQATTKPISSLLQSNNWQSWLIKNHN